MLKKSERKKRYLSILELIANNKQDAAFDEITELLADDVQVFIMRTESKVKVDINLRKEG